MELTQLSTGGESVTEDSRAAEEDLQAAERDFIDGLRDQVEDAAREGVPSRDENTCFATIIADFFEDAGVVESPVACVAQGRLGRAEWEVAGWAFSDSADEDQTDASILCVLYMGSTSDKTVGVPEIRRQFDRALVLLRGALDGRLAAVDGVPDLTEALRALYARRQALRRITVHVVTDAPTRRLREFESVDVEGVAVSCSVWGAERLQRLAAPTQEEIVIDVASLLKGKGLPALVVPQDDTGYQAFLCVIPGAVLSSAYEQYGQRLLELNVRAFLSITGKVNRGIRDTILTNPAHFFPYNNGLALVARAVDLQQTPEGGNEIVRIHGLQIVNGGQTTASLHRAWKVDSARDQVTKTFVQAKLIVVSGTEEDPERYTTLVRSISRNANSQNAVKADDLEANQPWHVAFDKLSQQVWAPGAESKWFYERARGSYSVAKIQAGTTKSRRLEFERIWPRAQVVTKTDLAKAANAWSQRPDIVSLGGQKNFLAFMRGLDDQLHTPRLDEAAYKVALGQIILYRDTIRIVRDLGDRIAAYRANVVAYLVAYLSHRTQGSLDFATIWEKQVTPPTVREALREWAVPIYECIVTSAGPRNVTEWCKRDGCWAAIRALDLAAPIGLARFASSSSVMSDGALLDSDDAAAVSECLRLQPHEWQALQDWCFRDPSVHFIVRGIVQTLRLQALNNWDKKPSVRQARPVAKLIKHWRTAGSA